jgi:hypothetical protein
MQEYKSRRDGTFKEFTNKHRSITSFKRYLVTLPEQSSATPGTLLSSEMNLF